MEFEEAAIVGKDIFDAVWHSGWFAVVKFFLAVYVIVLILDIVMLLILRGMGADVRKGIFGADMPAAHAKAISRQWRMVERYIESRDEAQRKVAVLEADRIAERVLEIAGYKGGNFRERLDCIDERQVEDRDDLLRAHEVRNDIIRDKHRAVSLEEAREVVGIFENFLKRWEAL